MALTNTNVRSQYLGNGASTVFATGFYFLTNSQVNVLLTNTLLVQGVDYAVAGAGTPGGGSVTLAVAPANGSSLTVYRVTPLVQSSTFVNNDALNATVLENGLDLLTMMAQEELSPGGSLDRALRYPQNEPPGYIATIPSVASRAGQLLGFDQSGALVATGSVGQPRGLWTTATHFNYKDMWNDPGTGNLYWVVAPAGYTSGVSVAADISANYVSLLIDAYDIAVFVSSALAFDNNQYAVSSSTANTYTLTLSSPPVAYQLGIEIHVKFTHANTGPATLNINGLGAQTIQRNGNALVGGEIVNNQTVVLIYDGTNFQIVNPSGVGGTVTSVTYTGDGTIFSSTPTSAVTTAGTLTPSLKTQSANTFLAGPTTGAAAVPTARAIVPADLPAATTTTIGVVSTDGNTLLNNSGAISVQTATPGQIGVVRPDGTIITVSGGVITVTTATSSQVGVCRPDNSTITISGGVISANPALPTALGVGSITLAKNIHGNVSAGNVVPSSGISSYVFTSTASPAALTPSTDSLTGNWQALQTIPVNYFGLYQRVS